MMLSRVETVNFTTESHPPRLQRRAWCEALGMVDLAATQFGETGCFFGDVSCVVSPLGMEFIRLASSAQDLTTRPSPRRKGIWLTLLLSGKSSVTDGDRSIDLAPGDMAFGPSAGHSRLMLHSDVVLLLVQIPESVLSHRVLAPLAVKLGCLSGDRGVSHVLSGTLISLVDAIDKLDNDQMRTLERLISNLFVASLAADSSAPTLGGAAGMRAALFNRIMYETDACLEHPDISARQVADRVGISLRYLQKLLQARGLSFSRHLLKRRLERIRDDLANPACADRSISRTCFRWGFRDAAWFSRAFRSRYGCSARQYRSACLSGTALPSPRAMAGENGTTGCGKTP
jgi:AraC-like DNA-binding protein